MQPHGNLTASYLWQPGEFARRMLGERPSPVPPTRELWPPQQQLSISTLHVAYLQDEPYTRRAATLPSQPYRKQDDEIVEAQQPTTGRLTAVRETAIDSKERKTLPEKRLTASKKAISGAKYRIAPGSETLDSPKISYELPKPGDRMTTTFGARKSKSWCKLPSREGCRRHLRTIADWCSRRPRRPPRRQSHPRRLQITQV
ncbi:hypothetical protein MSG28_010196 [Choristoneura fumiferana]|uniref:Uncharacterized protein n=1 Tax=Choristoneura fumiferana TaxID=7141 RepID=A0ACC0KJM9_CHOFU|nr:hypothetical protein MSG28_010196 [Choristoneura fumiferana]